MALMKPKRQSSSSLPTFDRSLGLTLKEAIEHYSARNEIDERDKALDEWFQLSNEPYPEPESDATLERLDTRYLHCKHNLESKLVDKLKAGELIAVGIKTVGSKQFPPAPVSCDDWSLLTANFAQSSAFMSGVTIADIHVHPASPPRTGRPGRPSGMELVIQEYKRRVNETGGFRSISEAARQLREWAEHRCPNEKDWPSTKAIRNALTARERMLS